MLAWEEDLLEEDLLVINILLLIILFLLNTENDIDEINHVITFLDSKFKIKDLGKLRYCLGLLALKLLDMRKEQF